MVEFINKEVSTQACQLEILTETKCVYVQMYDGITNQVNIKLFYMISTTSYAYMWQPRVVVAIQLIELLCNEPLWTNGHDSYLIKKELLGFTSVYSVCCFSFVE